MSDAQADLTKEAGRRKLSGLFVSIILAVPV